MGFDVSEFPPGVRERMAKAYEDAGGDPDKPKSKTQRGRPEANLQVVVMDYAQLCGVRVTHIPKSTANYTTYDGDGALPDLIFGYRGRTEMLELKAPGKRPSKHADPSRCQVAALAAFGGYWTDSADAAMRMIDAIVADQPVMAGADRKLIDL